MNIGINAGHTKTGPGSGANGIINESNETRAVSAPLMEMLRTAGHNVVNCTIDKAPSQNSCLSQIVNMANRDDLDYFISIHFNAGGGRGVEVYTYNGRQFSDALEVCQNISNLGFTNRGVRAGNGLYVIKKTKAKSMLIEVCFVDTEDANHYKSIGAMAIAQAIFNAIVDVNNGGGSQATQNTQTKPQASGNDLIRAGQQHSINFTGHIISVDGIKGGDTLRNVRRCVQHAINLDYGKHLDPDGYFQTKSKDAFGKHYVKRGEKQYMVTALEIALMCHGYNPNGVECPGQFGKGLEACVKQYQRDHGLNPDGVAGGKTFFSLMGI